MIASICFFLVFISWVYLASCFEVDSFYNLYVNRLRSGLFRPITAIQRTFPKLSEKAAAAVLVAVTLAVATLLTLLTAGPGGGSGGFAVGASFAGGRAILPMRPGSPIAAFYLTLGKFAITLGQLALLRLLLELRLRNVRKSPSRDFLDTAVWPLSLSKGSPSFSSASWMAAAKAGVVIFAGVALCIGATANRGGALLPESMLRLAALAAIDTLLLVRGILLVGCIASWITIIPSNPVSTSPWRALLEFISGLSGDTMRDIISATIGDNPLSVGFVSFAPLLMFFAIGLVHPLLAGLFL